MRASIVINTYNRCRQLAETLDSLRQLRYRDFEVIVVNGPSRDGTDELLEKWKRSVKIVTCPEANLSISRNIGIAAASGDIVAFLDDDAIPDPQWLDNIVGGYDSAEIAAVGGPVYNESGYEFQVKYTICDRFGNAIEDIEFNPTELFNVPRAPRYVSLLGANSSFRRSALVGLGGFDEEFAYYLDETDVCLRIVDSGQVVKYVDNAFVYHKFSSSELRIALKDKKILVQRYQPLKNKAYFCFKHGGQDYGYTAAMQEILNYANWHRHDAKWHIDWCVGQGYKPLETLEDLEPLINRAVADGVNRALPPRPVYLSQQKIERYKSSFKPFESRSLAKDRLNVCLLTQHYPPRPVDGIGRALQEFATALAALGHTVHILTQSDTRNSVDLEDGVWVYRLVVEGHAKPIENFPQRLWNYSRTMMKEVDRIHEHDRVDIIEAPAWDCEGVAALLDAKIPVITSLHTPMLIVASMHPNWMADGSLMEAEIQPMLEWEREVMLFSDGLAANTNAILKTIEQEYAVALDRDRVAVVGRGFHDQPVGKVAGKAIGPTEAPAGADLRLLFLGRLEFRKGIDVLLASLQDLLPKYPNLYADIVGEPVAESSKSFKEQFLEAADGAPWAARVTFHGRVDQEVLYDYIRSCDIFVAPSRFESFGLIFVQAMMCGKPCVGTKIGGISEVIVDGETGFLALPGDRQDLTRMIERLILSPELRASLGRAGRRRYEAQFTARAWAENSLAHYRKVLTAGMLRRERSGTDRSLDLTRHCMLSDFWVTEPLHTSLSRLGRSALHWKNWALSLAVESLRQKAAKNGSMKQNALLLSNFELPDVAPYAPGWSVENAPIGPAEFGSAPGERHRPARIGYGSAKFDVVWCLAALDPLGDAFAGILSELARVCRRGGAVFVVIGLQERAKSQGERLAGVIERSGLQSIAELATFIRSAKPASNTDERIEPCLGVKIAGEDSAIAALELNRV